MDIKLILRDKLALYLAVSPALLAFVFLAVLGNAASGGHTFAVLDPFPIEMVQRLERFGTVEQYKEEAHLIERVSRSDNVAGFTIQNNVPKIILEGNEQEGFEGQMQLLLSRALADDLPPFAHRQVESNSNMVMKITASLLLLFAIFVAGTVSGFNIIAERESRSIRALAISPLGLKNYIVSRSILSLLLAIINVVFCIGIMGKGWLLPQMLLVTLFCLPFITLVGFLLGSIAANQIAAIGTIKLLMPVCLAVPVISLFVPQVYHVLFYWMPNYWQYEAFASAWNGHINWVACIMTFFSSLVWFGLLYKAFSKKLQLR